MAVAIRSSNFQTYASGRTTTTLPAPSSIVNGDLLLAVINFSLSGNGLPTVTAPSGWTEGTNSGVFAFKASDTWSIGLRWFWKVASSESGSYNFTHAAAGTEGVIWSLSGANTTTPLSPAPTSGIWSGANGQTTTVSGLTTTSDGCLIILAESLWDDTVGMTPPGGTTPTFATRRLGTLLYVADGVLSPAGATGTVSHANGNNGGASAWAAALISVNAATGGGSDVTGTLAATETGSDTASFSGAVASSGSLSAAEAGSDTASFSGGIETSGSLAATETGSDTASFSGSVASTGSLAATETGNDTAALTGSVTPAGVSGFLAATESETDTASFTGTSEGGEVILPQQPNGDAGSAHQFKAKRRKVEDDPRNAVQRLVARFQEARAPVETPEPVEPKKPAKRPPVVKEAAPPTEPVEDLKAKAAAEEAERIRQEMEEDEEAAIMLLLAV